MGVNKGTAVSILLSFCKSTGIFPDFILCAGDDNSDEVAFKAVKHVENTQVFTCTIGKKPSEASCFVDSVEELTSMLETLALRIHDQADKTNLDDKNGVRFQTAFFCSKNLVSPQDVLLLTQGNQLFELNI